MLGGIGMRRILLAPIIAFAAGACEPTQLYIAHNTVVGLDASVNTERTAGRLMFGYDRQFVALAPKAVKPAPHKWDEQEGISDEAQEAMSAIACTEVEVDGIFLTKYSERLATGSAARDAARVLAEKSTPASLFQCWEAKGSDQTQGEGQEQ